MRFLITKAATSSLLRAVLIAAYCLQCNIVHIKGWFSPASRSRSSNQKRRAYDLVKTAFRFRSRLRRLRSAYDLVKTRLSERVGSRSRRTKPITKRGNVYCDCFILPLLLPTPTIWFSLDHKRNVSDGNVLILLTPIPSRLWLRLRLRFLIFTWSQALLLLRLLLRLRLRLRVRFRC